MIDEVFKVSEKNFHVLFSWYFQNENYIFLKQFWNTFTITLINLELKSLFLVQEIFLCAISNNHILLKWNLQIPLGKEYLVTEDVFFLNTSYVYEVIDSILLKPKSTHTQ